MDNRKNILVGIAMFIMIVITGSLIVWQSDIFRKVSGYKLVGRFDNIAGLLKGADVRYRGYSVGQVVSIFPTPRYIETHFFVDGKVKVPLGSKVKIMFDGLVGENYISIEANLDSNAYMENGAIIDGKSGSDLANFIDLGSQNLIHTEAILMTLRGILTDQNLIGDIKGTMENLEQITAIVTDFLEDSDKKGMRDIIENLLVISDSTRKITDVLSDDKTLSDLDMSLMNFNKISSNLDDFSRLSKSLLSDDNVSSFQSILSHLENASGDLDHLLGERQVGKSHIFSTFSSLSFGTETGVFYNAGAASGYFDSMFELGLGKYSLLTGIGNYDGDMKWQHFQQTLPLGTRFRTRFGIMYNEAGLGVDYMPTDKISLGANYYDFANNYFILSSQYSFLPHLQMQMKFRNDNSLKENQVDFGLNYDF